MQFSAEKGLCNFNLTKTGKKYISKMLQCRKQYMVAKRLFVIKQPDEQWFDQHSFFIFFPFLCHFPCQIKKNESMQNLIKIYNAVQLRVFSLKELDQPK